MKKPLGLNSAAAIKMELGNRLPLTPAVKMHLIYELMHVEVVDDWGNPVLKRDGTPKTTSLLTKKQARKLLGLK